MMLVVSHGRVSGSIRFTSQLSIFARLAGRTASLVQFSRILGAVGLCLMLCACGDTQADRSAEQMKKCADHSDEMMLKWSDRLNHPIITRDDFAAELDDLIVDNCPLRGKVLRKVLVDSSIVP